MKRCNAFFLAMLLAWLPAAAWGQNYITRLAEGSIDWTNAVIEAHGIGRGPSRPLSKAQARALAEKEAVKAARVNLAGLVMGMRVDGLASMGDLFGDPETFVSRHPQVLQDARVVDVRYEDDGSVRATVSWRWSGAPAEFLMPESIRLIEPLQETKEPHEAGPEPATGLVLDARGLKVVPAWVPRIVDEEGREVYSPAYVSREHAVSIGVAAYTKDLDSAVKSERSGPRPLVLKVIRVAQSGPCDLVISNDDARRVRGVPGNLKMLQQCRVTIVLD